MIEQIKKVKAFHKLTNNPWLQSPEIPDRARQLLRLSLIVEEYRELETACNDKDLVEVADALIDILYVVFGSIGEFGLEGIAEELFAEVHRSNMSKSCQSEQEAIETIEWYANKTDENKCEAYWLPGPNGTFIVTRVGDNKSLKSKYYSPADLKPIILKAIKNE